VSSSPSKPAPEPTPGITVEELLASQERLCRSQLSTVREHAVLAAFKELLALREQHAKLRMAAGKLRAHALTRCEANDHERCVVHRRFLDELADAVGAAP
jgi:hypothetical protein